jgi:hypothetical protein
MIGHLNSDNRLFKPTGRGGGSKIGKPQSKWPLVLVVGADAIVLRAKGSTDTWESDRKMRISSCVLQTQMDILFPGWESFVKETMPSRVTSRISLLRNRVYKQYYNGSSAGNNGDPYTRARKSKEHWKYQVVDGHPLLKLHDLIWRGQIVSVKDWRDYL